MPILLRLFMGSIAVFVIFMLVLAWRSGRIINVPQTYDVDENPMMYFLTFALHIFIFALCSAFAAGFTPAEVRDLAGLGWLVSLPRAGATP